MTKKQVIAAILTVTFPLWIVPGMVGALVYGLYEEILHHIEVEE